VLDDLSRVFTGDAMLIRGCGRTDFQQGSASTLYHSIHDKLYRWLPDSCALYSGHDYKGLTVSSIWEEKKYNPRLTKTEEEFINIMNNLNLPPPKKLAESVPANLVDGALPPK
jgi:sulfur dioxygenase